MRKMTVPSAPRPCCRSPQRDLDNLSLRLALRVFLVAFALLLAWAQFRPTLAGQSPLHEWRPAAHYESIAGSAGLKSSS